jgi:lipid-A-disaccharide synthase-like uncharacterized protein
MTAGAADANFTTSSHRHEHNAALGGPWARVRRRGPPSFFNSTDRVTAMENGMTWIAIGFLGQSLFSARFLVQWLSSERVKRSVVPRAFWYLSVAGGATLLAYAIHRLDPVFIVGQAAGLFVYLRNLQLIYQQQRVTDALQGKA